LLEAHKRRIGLSIKALQKEEMEAAKWE
jgi:hypothetical protein